MLQLIDFIENGISPQFGVIGMLLDARGGAEKVMKFWFITYKTKRYLTTINHSISIIINILTTSILNNSII